MTSIVEHDGSQLMTQEQFFAQKEERIQSAVKIILKKFVKEFKGPDSTIVVTSNNHYLNSERIDFNTLDNQLLEKILKTTLNAALSEAGWEHLYIVVNLRDVGYHSTQYELNLATKERTWRNFWGRRATPIWSKKKK